MEDWQQHSAQALKTRITAQERQIEHLQARLESTKDELRLLEDEDEELSRANVRQGESSLEAQSGAAPGQAWQATSPQPPCTPQETRTSKWPLPLPDYTRYSRHLLTPSIGLPGHLRLRASSILLIGAGGLGSPAAAYLAGAGVGTLGVVDGDKVEVGNLHRQVVHTTSGAAAGVFKVDSVAAFVRGLNPDVRVMVFRKFLTAQRALEIVTPYDLVLDCTDTPFSRYLVSDACVVAGKPLITASALGTDGQLMVLNNPPAAAGNGRGGPCYRCVFPRAPPREAVGSCGEDGIVGPVVGVMGVLMALEAIKLVCAGGKRVTTNSNTAHNGQHQTQADRSQCTEAYLRPRPTLLTFSAGFSASPFTSPPIFRNIVLLPRRRDCATCSSSATITASSLTSNSADYAVACGASHGLDVLAADERMSAVEFSGLVNCSPDSPSTANATHESDDDTDNTSTILDIRETPLHSLYSLPNTTHIPYSELSTFTSPEQVTSRLVLPDPIPEDRHLPAKARDVTVICALGNDSQLAVRKLKQLGLGGHKKDDDESTPKIRDVAGGWAAYRRLRAQQGEEWPDI